MLFSVQIRACVFEDGQDLHGSRFVSSRVDKQSDSSALLGESRCPKHLLFVLRRTPGASKFAQDASLNMGAVNAYRNV